MSGKVQFCFTNTDHGDLAVGQPAHELELRRSQIVDYPWTWLNQVHGAEVVTVSSPAQHCGAPADGAVTALGGVALCIQTADCAGVLLEADGAFGVAHCGWRGLEAGVLGATATALENLGCSPVRAYVGPTIRPRCYEFDSQTLATLARRWGPEVISETAWATPALNLVAGIEKACEELGIELIDLGTCTACSPKHWSYRARADTGRQALVAWIDP
ncbi:MAG: polyphenol oxidase family protein [Acidimicrobiales bacterium]|nr:polyphenol oxidase family protein [Acidimicrobiales bacterium]